MSDALAFGPAPKPRFGFFKKHRIVTWCMAFTLTVTSAAFAAWVVSNILTTQQNSKAEIGSATSLTGITTVLPTDAEVTSTCPAPTAGITATNCVLTLKVQNNSGQNVILTQLDWAKNGAATVTHSDGPVCEGSYTWLGDGVQGQVGAPVVPDANFLVGGSSSPGSNFISYTLPSGGLVVGMGVTLVEVPSAFGVNPNGAGGNFCGGSAVSFEDALQTVTFTAIP
jgi:hypothetical protein